LEKDFLKKTLTI